MKPIFLYLIFTVVAGCTDPELLLNGPGTELYVKDTTERARHEEKYFRLICLGDCHDNPDTSLYDRTNGAPVADVFAGSRSEKSKTPDKTG